MSKPTRVRFAPSPTGQLNLGGARSALFNYLFARRHGGRFILRLEDTDRQRLVPESVEEIQASLRWLGINWDEGVGVGGDYGPYTQSQRLDLYRRHAEQLLAAGWLYRCWCSPDRLDDLRQAARQQKVAFKYDRHCLHHPGNPRRPHVLRFRVPDQTEKIAWKDVIKGQVSIDTTTIDDFVAVKSDHWPTYHFANVVDDHAMQITHVLRADEWLASTPKHLLLYLAFNWPAPKFAHLPPVLGSDKAKLSKRHGAKPVLNYQSEGYLPDAIVNYLALLGWNAGEGSTQEIYTRRELLQAFSLERVQKSPALFDAERLDWMNGVYLRHMPLSQLLEAAEPFWPSAAAKTPPLYKQAVLGLVQERLKKLSELPGLTKFFFDYNPTVTKLEPLQEEWLRRSLEVANATKFESLALETAFRALVDELGTTPKLLFSFLRNIITGQEHTPPLFDTMAVLGQKNVTSRLKKSLKPR